LISKYYKAIGQESKPSRTIQGDGLPVGRDSPNPDLGLFINDLGLFIKSDDKTNQ